MKTLENEENVNLYTKTGLMCITTMEKAEIFTDILARNNHGFSVYDATEASQKYPVQISYVNLHLYIVFSSL